MKVPIFVLLELDFNANVICQGVQVVVFPMDGESGESGCPTLSYRYKDWFGLRVSCGADESVIVKGRYLGYLGVRLPLTLYPVKYTIDGTTHNPLPPSYHNPLDLVTRKQ